MTIKYVWGDNIASNWINHYSWTKQYICICVSISINDQFLHRSYQKLSGSDVGWIQFHFFLWFSFISWKHLAQHHIFSVFVENYTSFCYITPKRSFSKRGLSLFLPSESLYFWNYTAWFPSCSFLYSKTGMFCKKNRNSEPTDCATLVFFLTETWAC